MRDIYLENKKRNKFGIFFRRFSVTNWLIIINIISFIVFGILSYIIGEDKVSMLFALQANSFFFGRIWTLITSMFMHANIWHLFFNMMSLFFIGNFVERLIGRKRLFWFYMAAGIIAGLFYVSLSYFLGNFVLNFGDYTFKLGEKIFLSPSTFAVGASGAIFGLVGLLALLTPNNKVYLLAGPLIAIILESFFSSAFPNAGFMSALDLLITFYFFISLFSIFLFNSNLRKVAVPVEMSFWVLPIVAIVPLVIIGLFVTLPIGNTAHFGGLIAGLFYAGYLRSKYKKKAALIRKSFGG
jgi:membrane associated rhomboid family serine protease